MPDLTPEERGRIATAVEWLHEFVSRIEDLRASAAIMDGSARAVDVASPVSDLAYDIAALKLSAADDYLRSVAILMSGAIPRYGCYVLMRSALEAAAVTYWMMEPGLEVRRKSVAGQRVITDNVASLDRGWRTATARRKMLRRD